MKSWISCPLACDAPVNDLMLYRHVSKYAEVSKPVSDIALMKLDHHLWYVGPELVPLALFSSKVSVEKKRFIVASMQLLQHSGQDSSVQGIRLERCLVAILMYLPVVPLFKLNMRQTNNNILASSNAAFKLCFCNIRGILSNREHVLKFLDSEKPAIFSVCETFLTAKHADISDLSHPDYSILRRDRPIGHGGGIVIYINNSLVVTRRSEFESPDHELIWLSFLVQKRYVFLCSAYRPPSSDTSLFPLLSSSVDLILSRHNAAEIILLGDFNCHHATWLNSSSTDNFGETMFSELIVGQGLTQLVKEPTRHATNSASSLLDLLLTNSPGLHDVKVSVPLGTSDHSVVTSLIKGSIVPTIKKGHRQIFLYSKADWNGLKGYFRILGLLK